MKHPDSARVEIDLPATSLRTVSTLLAYGIKIEAPAGTSIQDVLAGVLKIDAEYLEKTVQTVLHDGKPVDDLVGHRVTAPSVIALSAALPGLFGAAFRKGGTFSPLRQTAETSRQNQGNTGQPIEITVKLFNLVANALGPELLRRGIRMETSVLLHFLKNTPDLERLDAISARLDGTSVPLESLKDLLASRGGDTLLIVRSGG